jgi:hypothetical protein
MDGIYAEYETELLALRKRRDELSAIGGSNNEARIRVIEMEIGDILCSMNEMSDSNWGRERGLRQ